MLKTEESAQDPDHSKYTILYPAYVDSTLSRGRGRRVAVDKCADTPYADDLYNCLVGNLGFTKVVIDPTKRFPRESHFRRGRVLVDLTSSSKCTAKNKYELLMELGPLVAALENPTRERIKEHELKMAKSAPKASNARPKKKKGKK